MTICASSTRADATVPSTSIPHLGEESYENIWQKVVSIVNFVVRYYRAQFDWFYLSGDDAYLIVENLKHFLSHDDAVLRKRRRGEGIFLGQQFFLDKTSVFDDTEREGVDRRRRRPTYNTGGAGYVLDGVSLEVLARALAEDDHRDPCNRTVQTSAEDVYVANCLRRFGILPMETRDESGRERFHHFSPALSYYFA